MMPLAQSLKRIKKNKTMGYIKTFVLGIATAYGIYYLTKKRKILYNRRVNTSVIENTKNAKEIEVGAGKNS